MFVIEQPNPNFNSALYDDAGQARRHPVNNTLMLDREKSIRREVEGDDFKVADKPAGMLIIMKGDKAVGAFPANMWSSIRKIETEEV